MIHERLIIPITLPWQLKVDFVLLMLSCQQHVRLPSVCLFGVTIACSISQSSVVESGKWMLSCRAYPSLCIGSSLPVCGSIISAQAVSIPLFMHFSLPRLNCFGIKMFPPR